MILPFPNYSLSLSEPKPFIIKRSCYPSFAAKKYDTTHTVVRFATSWATRPEDIDTLANILRR